MLFRAVALLLICTCALIAPWTWAAAIDAQSGEQASRPSVTQPVLQATPIATPVATPVDTPSSLLLSDVPAALIPDAQQALRDLSVVQINATLDPAQSTISGEMAVTWRNPVTVPLGEVWFRLFPNATYYGEGGMTVRNVTVDGTPVTPELALDDTALRVPLPAPVDAGGSVQITMQFAATVPTDSTGSYGIFTHDTQAGLWVLADWHPLLAVYEPEDGWSLPAVTSFGDPTYAPGAFYDVTVTAPENLLVASSGISVQTATTDGQTTRRTIAGPARDFVMVAAERVIPVRKDVGGTQVTLWTAPDLDPSVAARTLEIAGDVLRNYQARWGTYPLRELELIQVNPSGALGIAWTGLLFLDGPTLLEGYGERNDDGLAAVIAHEVSHLWWGVLVGGDSNEYGYIPEALATVSALLYIDDAFGSEVAREELNAWAIEPARRLLRDGDAIVNLPVSDDQDASTRYAALYGKGTLGFLAIREAIGAEAFDATLRQISRQYAWREMTPAQLQAAFEQVSGQDLQALWAHWFDEATMTESEIDTLAAAFD
ncbi:MAG: M1 family metallopeptidase [Thermomicrobiales bacterium]